VSNYFFKSPLLKILKTQTHNPTQNPTLTMTAKLNADNGCKTRTTKTPACNTGLAAMAGDVDKSTVVLLISFGGWGQVSSSKPPPSPSPKPLAVIGPGQFGHLTGDTLLTKISHWDK